MSVINALFALFHYNVNYNVHIYAVFVLNTNMMVLFRNNNSEIRKYQEEKWVLYDEFFIKT